MRHPTKKITYLGLLTAIALVLSYVELLLPPITAAVPGIKMGLPNIVIIYILYRFGLKYAACISLTRVLIVSLLFGNVVTLAYSLAGAVLSIFVMYILKRIGIFSAVGVSIAGGVMHNLGQTAMAALLLGTSEILYYMAVLAISGTVAGVLVGLAGSYLIKRL